MKAYLVHELNKSGSELGEFIAQEVEGDTKSSGSDLKARSQVFLENK